MRVLLLLLAVSLTCLGGCATTSVIEKNENKVGSLTAANEYYLRPLAVSFKAPEGWAVSKETWDAWLQQWQNEYNLELRKECRKTLLNIDADAKQEKGYVVTCDIYEMDSGGFAGVGGKAYARAKVRIVDAADGTVLFDGKLQGTSTTEPSVEGRLNGAVNDLAEEIARILMQGA
ncbi:MAG: hypothetical protein KF754_10630 [Planctomycetes bacterium]|nr:hypothetical protein [Planctomycetota bacterium]